MNEKDLIAWFEDLLSSGGRVPWLPNTANYFMYREPTVAAAWLAEAETALASVFPPEHPLRSAWRAVFERAKVAALVGARDPNWHLNFSQAIGVIGAALAVLKGGRLRSVLDGARAQTVSEVIDQADALVSANHALAAAVLAGGALETHLLHLCIRNAIAPTGEGSIGKYDQAIAQARNSAKVTVYSVSDSGLVGSWGKMRNLAAHEPTKFRHTPDEVRRMVEGIREFIARVP